jgi:MFS family permease
MQAYIQGIRQYSGDIKLYLLFTLCSNVGIGIFQLIYNLYLLELGFREDFIGAFNAIHTAGVAIMSLAMGIALNRFGVWRVVTVGFGIFLTGNVLLTLITNSQALLALAILGGIGTAFLFVPVMPFIVEITRSAERHGVAALTFSLGSLSMTFASLVGGYTPRTLAAIFPVDVPSAEAFRYTMLVGIAIAGLAYLPLLRMSSRVRNARPEDQTEDTSSGMQLADPERIRRHMIVFIAVGGMMSIGAGMVFPFYNVYLSTIGASASQIGLIFSISGLGAALLGLTSPYLSSRLGPQMAVLLVRCSPLPLFALLIFYPSLWIAIVAYVIRTASINMGWPIDSSYIAGVLPPKARTVVFGYRSGAWNIGFALASFLGGIIIVRYGYGVTFGVLIVFMLLAMVLFYSYFSRYNPRDAATSRVSTQPLVDPVPDVMTSRKPRMRRRSRK